MLKSVIIKKITPRICSFRSDPVPGPITGADGEKFPSALITSVLSFTGLDGRKFMDYFLSIIFKLLLLNSMLEIILSENILYLRLRVMNLLLCQHGAYQTVVNLILFGDCRRIAFR